MVTNTFCKRLRQYMTFWSKFRSYFAPKNCDIVASQTKNVNSIQEFENRLWKTVLVIFVSHTEFRIYWFGLNCSYIYEVHFLHGAVPLKLWTTLFTKPTDSNFYRNTSSCHTSRVLKIIPKGQFIRLRRICSQKPDYLLNSKILCRKFTEPDFL